MRGFANLNLKGKKFVMLSCRCCVCVNRKDEYFNKLAEKEIREYNKYEDE